MPDRRARTDAHGSGPAGSDRRAWCQAGGRVLTRAVPGRWAWTDAHGAGPAGSTVTVPGRRARTDARGGLGLTRTVPGRRDRTDARGACRLSRRAAGARLALACAQHAIKPRNSIRHNDATLQCLIPSASVTVRARTPFQDFIYQLQSQASCPQKTSGGIFPASALLVMNCITKPSCFRSHFEFHSSSNPPLVLQGAPLLCLLLLLHA